MAAVQLLWPRAGTRVALAAGDAHVWAVVIDDVPVARDQLWAVLSADERERAERFRFDQPRNRFVAARAALRQLLSRYLDAEPDEIGFQYDAYGKPALAGQHRELSLRFNLAHSGSLAVVAITSGCDIGADIECLRPVRQAEGISQRYFHPAEAAEVLGGNNQQMIERFFRCWTRKEAVIKAIGSGLQFPLDQFCVPMRADVAAWVDLPTGEKTTAERAWLGPCFPASGYVGAIATLDAKRDCKFYSLALEECF